MTVANCWECPLTTCLPTKTCSAKNGTTEVRRRRPVLSARYCTRMRKWFCVEQKRGRGLDQVTAEGLLELDLPDGFSSYGRDAIDKLLPFLEQGLPLMTRNETPCALKLAGYLRPDQRHRGQKQFLPEPPEVTNPLVRQAPVEVRKLVNAIIREHDGMASK